MACLPCVILGEHRRAPKPNREAQIVCPVRSSVNTRFADFSRDFGRFDRLASLHYAMGLDAGVSSRLHTC
jgi:hypothetical protein